MNFINRFSSFKTILLIFWLSLIAKGMVWLVTVPVWHGPDEQVHFSQVAFYAEMGRRQQGREPDVTKEIYRSTELLGTLRDERGNNRFTFHPEYRIEDSGGLVGKYEDEIRQLASDPDRMEMVGIDASHYPPLYYWLSARVYDVFYESSLFDRIFGVRMLSLIFGLGSVVVAYFIGREIFEEKLYALGLAILVGYQPMFSFVSATFNSDNLFNFLFSIMILFGVRVAKGDIRIQHWPLLFLVLVLLAYTKPQWVLAIPIIVLALAIRVFVNGDKLAKWVKVSFGAVMVFGLTFSFWAVSSGLIHVPEATTMFPRRADYSIIEHGKYVLHHTVREVIPWYWGVFNWLGVTLPRWINRVQMRILGVVVLGLGIWVSRVVKNKKRKIKQLAPAIFLLFSGLVYFLGIEAWEFLFIKANGYGYGMQGRYYFPTIVSHMFMVLFGVLSLFSKKWRYRGVFILILWWMALQVMGMMTLLRSYYSVNSIGVLVNQISQYNPDWAKGGVVTVLIVLSIVLNTLLVIRLIYELLFVRYHLSKVSKPALNEVLGE